ncbi:MAG: hypothetical protein SVT56_04480 [Chloroflexota bacterium]|nr:hypothetical protein [Chloroflexota bacterium]
MTLIPRRPVIQLYQLVSGRRFLHHLDELNRTQWLDRDELLNLQRVKLHRLLEKAYTYVPYYRRLFDDVGFKPDDILRDMKFLQKIPFLTKDIIRANLEDLQTTDPQIQPQLSSLSTSGSSGQPLQFV